MHKYKFSYELETKMDRMFGEILIKSEEEIDKSKLEDRQKLREIMFDDIGEVIELAHFCKWDLIEIN